MPNDEKDSAAPPPDENTKPTVPDGFEHFQDPNAVFFVHNTSRGRHNRTLRAHQPVHGGMKQHIGGEHRLVRGRPLGLTVGGISKHIKELLEKEAAGLIEVRSRDGRRLDLLTGKLLNPGTPAPVTLPNFPLDSAARDKNGGQIMTQFPGDVPTQDDDPNKVPALFGEGLPTEEEDPVQDPPPADPLAQADEAGAPTEEVPQEETPGSTHHSSGKKKGKSNR